MSLQLQPIVFKLKHSIGSSLKRSSTIPNKIPVYLSKSLLGQLHIFQYPVRPHTHSYDDANIMKAQIKPEAMQVELELGLQTRGPTYDRSKGEQIAINVDGAFRDEKDCEEKHFSSKTMDKLVLTSAKAVSDVSRYAVGVMGEGSLYLTPLSTVLALRPSFTYLDLADQRGKLDRKEQSDDSDNEEKMKKVTVRFERPETERSKAMKEKSYGYLQKKSKEEPWIPVQYNRFGSEKSEFDSQFLYCSHQNEDVDQFGLDNAMYLKQLIPLTFDKEVADSERNSYFQFYGSPKELPLEERLETLMLTAKVVSFPELVNAVRSRRQEDNVETILKLVQQVAVLIQGNWVVKSDILYPKDSPSESSVPNEVLQKARDCVLYLFTKSSSISRKSVSDLIEVPPQDLSEILKGISRCSGVMWDFLLPQDNNFIQTHTDVTQRQQMIWQSRYEQLSHCFKKLS